MSIWEINICFLETPRNHALKNCMSSNKCWRRCGEKVTLLYCGGNANQYSHYGEQCGDSLKNWK